MRFVHLSDTHLGYRQYNREEREQDFYATWRQAIDKILQERPDFVLHSGDLFEDRRPPIQALVEARAGVRRLREAGIPFYYITGNHDQPTRAGALCPQAVLDEAIPLENRPLEKDGLYLAGVSYHSKLNAHLLRQQMAHHARRAASARWRVFALHQGIDRYVPEYELKFAELRDFHYYAAGHIHRRVADHSGQSLVAYPGSLDIWRIDEYDDWKKYGKGFYLVDLAGDEPEVQRLNVEVRPFLKGEVTPETLEREVERLHQCARGTVVYLDVYSPREDYARLAKHIQEHLGPVALQVNLRPRAP
ncbi:MAG: exonuclease SbcCD subunit D, partial [Euryarchaeota archaeon]|nr:exonuclease SbcCD subunit D [Euryarchaeota archaeon]